MTGTGRSAGETLTPLEDGWFMPLPQEVLLNSAGESSMSSTGTASGQTTSSANSSMSGSSQGQSEGRSRSRSDGRTTGQSRARSVGVSSGSSYSEIVSEGETHGTSKSHSVSEGLEPIYENLPSAVHSMENMLYFAAQRLRSLKTGEALIHFAGTDGIASAEVLVPRVRTVVRTDEQFRTIRTLILQTSTAALTASQADRAMELREQSLFAEARQLRQAAEDSLEPENFRVRTTARASALHSHGDPNLAGERPVKGGNRQRRRPSGALDREASRETI
jgi:hypothetical protein